MISPILFLFGYQRFQVEEEEKLEILNLALWNQMHLFGLHSLENGGISFSCDRKTAQKLMNYGNEHNMKIKACKVGGVPGFLQKRKKRFGVYFGSLAGILLLLLSQKVVWQVNISGNESVSCEMIEEELKNAGFGVGTYFPNLDFGGIENRVLKNSDCLSWISICMNGTVAQVQVKESVGAEEQKSKKPANLVASADGQIEGIEVYRGDLLVTVGQAVKAGEVLVSGVYDSQAVGYRLTRANGKIYARVNRTLSYEIPLETTQKNYQKSCIGAIDLNFFGFSMKIYKNSRKNIDSCDIIESKKSPENIGLPGVPISFYIQTLYPYTQTRKLLSEEEATQEALQRLEKDLKELSASIQLLEKEVETHVEGNVLILECRMVTIEDIAEQREFEADETQIFSGKDFYEP